SRYGAPLSALPASSPPLPSLSPYTTLFRSLSSNEILVVPDGSTKEAMAILESLPHITHIQAEEEGVHPTLRIRTDVGDLYDLSRDRKSTRLNSSHVSISYAVFCLKKKKRQN